MPGLFGFVNADPAAHRPAAAAHELLAHMATRLRHRADYEVTAHVDVNGTFGVARIGMAHHHRQPWPRPDGPAAYFAGVVHASPEIDARGELSRDGAADPLRALAGARGFWAGVARSPTTTVIATDRRSSIPLFYVRAGSTVYFAPEVKAFLGLPGVPARVDLGTLATLLVSGYLPGRSTLFEDVRRLGPAEALVVDRDKVQLRRYWRMSPGGEGARAGQDLLEDLGDRLADAVRENLAEPDATVIFLSGGLDSRAVVAAAAEAVGDPRGLHTVSWGREPAAALGDVEVGRMVAEHLGTAHRFEPRRVDDFGEAFERSNYLTDGVSDVAALHPAELGIMERLSAAGFRIGLRGDEVFGFYHRLFSAEQAAADVSLRRLGDVPAAAPLFLEEHRRSALEASAALFASVIEGARGVPPLAARARFSHEQYHAGYLVPAAVVKQSVLDHRNVVMDDRMLDAVPAIPASLLLKKRAYAAAIARRYPWTAALPQAVDSDLEDWALLLASDSAPRRYAEDALADSASGIWDYLDRDAVRALLEGLRTRTGASAPPWRAELREHVKHMVDRGAPRLAARARAARARSGVGPETLLLRVLTLKHWHDSFVAPSGGGVGGGLSL